MKKIEKKKEEKERNNLIKIIPTNCNPNYFGLGGYARYNCCGY